MLHRGKFLRIARRSWFLPAPARTAALRRNFRSTPC